VSTLGMMMFNIMEIFVIINKTGQPF
jgi:hypothetical protein